MKLQIKKASTDVSIYVFIQDSSSTTGAGLTGLVYNSAGLTCYYVRPLAAAAQLTLATLAAATSAHSDGGFKEVDSTNMPGVYRLDLSDAIVASGVNSVVVMLKGATNMAQLVLEIELVAYDPQDATSLGISRIDGTISSRASQTSLDTVDDFLDTEIAAIKAKTDNLPTDPADDSDIDTQLAAIAGYLDTEIAAIKAKTDNLPASPAATGDIPSAATIADAVWDEDATAHQTQGTFGQAIGDPGADTSTIFDLVNTNLDATVSSRASQTSLDTLDDYVDTEVAAIKAKTDNLPASPAAVGSAMTLTSGERTAIANEVEAQIIDDTDSEKVLTAITDKIASVNPSLDDLTLAGIASAVRTELTTELARIDAAVSSRLASGTIASDVTAIKAKTDNLPSDPADASVVAGLIAAVETKVDTVDTVVDAIKVTTDKLDDTLEDDAGTYRFTENALEQAPSGGGGGATASQIADAVWDERIDDHLSDRSFGAKIGIHLPFVAPDFDYRKIKEIVSEIAAKIEQMPQPEKVDLIPVSEGLQAVIQEIRDLPKPKDPEKTDYSPILKKLDALSSEIKAIEIPEPEEVDLTPVLDKLDDTSAMREIVNDVDQILQKIRTFFTEDISQVKQGQKEMLEKLDSVQMVVLEKKEEKPKTNNSSVLEEYLNL